MAQQPRPWTQERLAHELEKVAAELSLPIASRRSLLIMISRWENGHIAVGPDYGRLFRRVYAATDEELGFVENPDERAALVLGPISFAADWAEFFEQAAEEWRTDMQRRHLLRQAGYAAAASTLPALQWFSDVDDSGLRTTRSGTLVGRPHVEMIRGVTGTYRQLDNRFGGRHARESLLRFISQDVAPLLQDGRYDSGVRGQLFSAAGEAMQVAGWMTCDAGHHGLGQRYLAQALRLAKAADDTGLGGEIMAALSHQASYVGDGVTAIDLARASRKAAKTSGVDALVAESHVMEAHGHASNGDGGACARSLTAAERAFDSADRTLDPAWIGYFDEAYLSAKFGHCFKSLQDTTSAERFARRSLVMDESFVRGRIFNLMLLASVHVQTGDIEEACRVGTEGIPLMANMNSSRAKNYLRDLRGQLAPYASTPGVRAFLQASQSLALESIDSCE